MQFHVLGGLEVGDGTSPLDLGPPKQRMVLAVLLLERDRVVSADRLVELLWGEDLPKAISSLQAYVSRLRSILEPARLPRDPATVLITQPPGYRLVVARGAVDLLCFEDLVAAGRDRLRAGDAVDAIALLDKALSVWTGPLLPEFADEPFVLAAASRVEQLRLAAFEAAAEARLSIGDHQGALALLEPEATAHPLREGLHGLLALALYRSRRQADALRVVDRCRKSLADIAGLEPGPELRKLEADLLAQSPSLDWQPSAAVPVPAGPPRSGLVGRVAEFGTLADALAAAGEGRGGVAIVIGDPGIGKTRLAEELVALANERGITTAWARCPESGAAPPYWPATQLGDQLRAAGVVEARLIAPLDEGTSGVGPQARFGLYRAILDTIASVDRPLLLAIDDLQWADPDSLRLLENIAGDLASTRTLLVVTTRPLTDDSPSALIDCLAEIARGAGSVQLRLDGLAVGDVSDWLSRRTDVDVPAEVAELVHDRTAGNPLFIKELADLLAAEGRLGDVDSVRTARAIPPGVQFVVRRRVSRLPLAGQQLLSIAAVIGRTFDVGVVAAAAELDGGHVLDALAPALDAGLLVDAGGNLSFSHALVAVALAEEVNAARRARIHAAAARTLAGAAGPNFGTAAAAIAHHALEGILAGTGDLAVEASTVAARQAAARFADEDAAGHWADVATALARSKPGDIAGRVDALIEQARALTRADVVEAAKGPALAAIDIAGAAGLVVQMGQAASLFNHAHVWTNEGYGIVDQQIVAALERTLAASGGSDPVRRADLLGALAGELVFADPARHRSVCAEAEATARAGGDPLTLARILIDVMLPNRSDDVHERLARAGEILQLVDENDLPPEVAFAGHHHTAVARMEIADFDNAILATARGRRVLDASPGSRFRSQLYWFEASIAQIRGRYEDAAALVNEAYELHRRARGYDADVMRLIGVAAISIDRGGLETMVDFAVAMAQQSAYRRPTSESMAFAMLELGAVDVARQLISPFGSSTSFVDDWTTVFSATAALHVRVELGADGVAGLFEFLTPYSDRWSCCGTAPISMGLVSLALARGAAALGDSDRARTLFETAVAEHDRIGAVSWLARSLVHQGIFLREAFDASVGETALERAADLAERHGFPYVRRRLDHVQR